MIASIHQPHYFPWIGYFDKMAKTDAFVLLDEVQFEKGSQMIRNRVLDGNGDIKFLTISGETKDFMDRKYNELKTKDVSSWTQRQLNALQNYYRKAPGCNEMMPIIEEFLSRDYETICQWTCASIELIRNLLQIKTPLIYQSSVEYDRDNKKSDLIYAICNAIGADTYFSGRGGSMTYLNREKFAQNHVKIVFQDFDHPVYTQPKSDEFKPGLSILDLFFSCGVDESRRVFWETVNSTHEFEGSEKQNAVY